MRGGLDWTGIMLDDPEAHGLKAYRRCHGDGLNLRETSDRPARCGGRGLVVVGSQRQQERSWNRSYLDQRWGGLSTARSMRSALWVS